MDERSQRGTILSCPAEHCGLGRYRIVAPATFEDLVIFDDKDLAPLNNTISPYDVWPILACPFCGARLLKDGKVHTLQNGWLLPIESLRGR
jgi:hypothetical protein